MNAQPPIVIAHRGAAGEAPENTLAAFKLALEQGCDAFELDVHLSGDGEIVVIHDDTVDRTTNGQGEVSGLSLAELKTFDAGGWFGPSFAGERIPTLEEVLDLTPPHIEINVEVKGGVGQGMEERLAALLRRKGRTGGMIVSSFHFESLALLNRIEPTLRTGLLYQQTFKHPALLPQAAGVETFSLHPYYAQLEEEQIAEAAGAGLAVYPWTANEEEDLRRMIGIGASGIITDFPGRLRRMLND